jgi:hypothetical protein
MAQNRKPPAFQEYAATFLASKEFRLMSLEERGLLMTMRFECWENKNVPASPAELAAYLGLKNSNAPLTSRVMSFFVEQGTTLVCPELEDYRQYLKERREKQSNGGKQGAKKTNAFRLTQQGTRDSLVELNSNKFNQEQSLEKEVIDDEFVRDYENEPDLY